MSRWPSTATAAIEDFFGYGHHRSGVRFDRLAVLPARSLAAGSEAVGSMDGWPQQTRSRARRTATVLHPGAERPLWRLLSQSSDLAALYTDDYAAELDADRLALHLIKDPWVTSTASNLIDRVLDVDIQTMLPGMFLVKADIAAMAHSLEVRSPLLDHRFMEMAARLAASRVLPEGSASGCSRMRSAPGSQIGSLTVRRWDLACRSATGFAGHCASSRGRCCSIQARWTAASSSPPRCSESSIDISVALRTREQDLEAAAARVVV